MKIESPGASSEVSKGRRIIAKATLESLAPDNQITQDYWTSLNSKTIRAEGNASLSLAVPGHATYIRVLSSPTPSAR